MPNNWENNRNERQNSNFNRNDSSSNPNRPNRGGDRYERGSSLNQMGSQDHNYDNSDEGPYYDTSRDSSQSWSSGRANRDYPGSHSSPDRSQYGSNSGSYSYDRNSNPNSGSTYGGGTNYGTSSTFGSSYGTGSNYDRNAGMNSDSSYSRNNPYYSGSTFNSASHPNSNAWDRYSQNLSNSYGRGSYNRDFSGTTYGSFGDTGSMNSTSNAGKGPKNYKRTDERIREDVSEILERDPHVNASEIEVMVKDGVVTLSGTVDHRLAKRHAEDIIEHASGVTDVKNELKVDQNIFSQMKEMVTGEQVPKSSGDKKNPRH